LTLKLKVKELFILKKCFAKLNEKRCKRKRRLRGRKNRKHTRRECGYDILGRGSSSGSETFFTPVIFQRKRGIRTTRNNGTIWLSETPEDPSSKVEGASDFSIASWAHFKLAIDKKKKQFHQNLSTFGKFLWILTNTVNRKNNPKTKWIDLFIVNAQLDTADTEIAVEQLEILLNYMERKGMSDKANSVILKLGTSYQFTSGLAPLLQTKGFSNIAQTARSEDKTIKENDSIMIWSKGVDSILSSAARSDENREEAFISALLYNAN